MSRSLAKAISPIIIEIGDTLWDDNVMHPGEESGYTDEAFAGGLKIFMEILQEKLWEMEEINGTPQEDRVLHVERMAIELRMLIRRYTKIDTRKLYGEYRPDKDKTTDER